MAEKKMTEAAVLALKVGLNPGAEAMGIGPGRHVVALQHFSEVPRRWYHPTWNTIGRWPLSCRDLPR
jgi:hypothetical protein